MTVRRILGDSVTVEYNILMPGGRIWPVHDMVRMALQLEEFRGDGELRKKVAQWRKQRRYKMRDR